MSEQTMAARLATIMGEVGRIEKKGKIKSFGSGPSYNFARDTDVLEAVTPKMAEAGIVMVPEHVELLSTSLTMSEKQYVSNIKTAWHVTDGHESLRFETFGQGADTGDKALPKAQSNARKYAFFMLYHIVTGDDPDHWASDDQPERGERATEPGRRSGGTSAGSAPVPSNKGEALSILADVGRAHGLSFAKIEAKAKEMGVERGSASVDDIMRVVRAIEQPPEGVPPAAAEGGADGARASAPSTTPNRSAVEASPSATPGDSDGGGSPPAAASESPAAPTDEQILAAAGEGAEIVDEPVVSPELQERINKARAKGKKSEPEQESLAAALGAPESDR